MVKVIGPVFSLMAEGNLGDVLNYHVRRDQSIVRHKRSSFPLPTEALRLIQGFMRHTVWTWQHLTQNLKDDWDTWAATYKPDGSGYNSFVSYYIKDLILEQVPDLEPPT